MSAVDYCICIEELARVDPAVSLSVAAHNGLCAAHICMFGTEAQKQQYLVPLARGEKLGAWGLTEASARAATRRRCGRPPARDGDGWVLNGSKTFITHGAVGDVIVVMAVTDRGQGQPRASPPSSSSAARRACRAGKKEDKLGMRASETSEVIFENCRVPASTAARRGRAGLHQHAAGARRRPHRHRGAGGRPRAGRLRGGARLRARAAGSSASRSARFRRFSGSWPTTRPASRRRGC